MVFGPRKRDLLLDGAIIDILSMMERCPGKWRARADLTGAEEDLGQLSKIGLKGRYQL